MSQQITTIKYLDKYDATVNVELGRIFFHEEWLGDLFCSTFEPGADPQVAKVTDDGERKPYAAVAWICGGEQAYIDVIRAASTPEENEERDRKIADAEDLLNRAEAISNEDMRRIGVRFVRRAQGLVSS